MKLSRTGTLSLFVSLSLLCSSLPVKAQMDGEVPRRSLRGIETLDVLIEQLPESAQKLGLSKDSLQTDVELKLRQNSITVTDVKDLKSQATLYVLIDVIGTAASLSVSLGQPVRLIRDQSVFALATTWEVRGIASNPSAKFIREHVADMVDQFLNAWLSVNPRTR